MKKRGFTKGFTLIELMVTITIMLIMTAVVFFNYSKFNDSSLLSALAYDMSLTIRQAQVYGVATREGGSNQSVPITIASISTYNNADFVHSYGVHFDSSTDALYPLILFVDSNNNGYYDSGEALQSYTFQKGITIQKLCYLDTSCSTMATNLDIVFTRPDPEATFLVSSQVKAGPVTIFLQNANHDLFKSVVVYSTGQISVQ